VVEAEAGGEGPVDEEGFADDVAGGDRAPGAGIVAVAGVIAHEQVGIRAVGVDGVGIWKQGREVGAADEFAGQGAVHVTRVLIDLRRLLGIKSVNFIKMWRGGIEPVAIDDEVTVIADLNAFAGEDGEALNEVFIGFVDLGAESGKDGDITALGFAKIVAQTVHQQMITGADAKADDVFAFFIFTTIEEQPCVVTEVVIAVVGWEPEGVPFAGEFDLLVEADDGAGPG